MTHFNLNTSIQILFLLTDSTALLQQVVHTSILMVRLQTLLVAFYFQVTRCLHSVLNTAFATVMLVLTATRTATHPAQAQTVSN